MENSEIIGAGGYGIVIRSQHGHVTKLFKDYTNLNAPIDEARIQNYIYFHLPKSYHVHIPIMFDYTTKKIFYKDKPYLYGIEMEYLPPPHGFDEQVHMLLGYHGDDIDEEWGVQTSQPVSPQNPTRGFFASPETLEMIWKEEGSEMTINKLAFLMGRTNAFLLKTGILPIDVEWVWSNGKPGLIDFGLCEFGQIDPYEFLHKKGLKGLADDFYIPHEGDRGYDEFMKGFDSN